MMNFEGFKDDYFHVLHCLNMDLKFSMSLNDLALILTWLKLKTKRKMCLEIFGAKIITKNVLVFWNIKKTLKVGGTHNDIQYLLGEDLAITV